jgi:hypothetical protein
MAVVFRLACRSSVCAVRRSVVAGDELRQVFLPGRQVSGQQRASGALSCADYRSVQAKPDESSFRRAADHAERVFKTPAVRPALRSLSSSPRVFQRPILALLHVRALAPSAGRRRIYPPASGDHRPRGLQPTRPRRHHPPTQASPGRRCSLTSLNAQAPLVRVRAQTMS